jgi:outer membrane immunogenic protein
LVPGQINTRGGGGLFGGTVGYNYQVTPSWVLGVEGDFDWSGIKGNGSQTLTAAPLNIPVSLTTTGSSQLNWIGTVRGRVGWLLDPATMIFATGGLAFGEVETNVLTTLTAGPFSAQAALNQTSTKTGWTIGGGFEHQFWGRWSLKAEYRYVDLDGTNGPFGTALGGGAAPALLSKYVHEPIPVTFDANQGTRYQMGLVGLNYRF